MADFCSFLVVVYMCASVACMALRAPNAHNTILKICLRFCGCECLVNDVFQVGVMEDMPVQEHHPDECRPFLSGMQVIDGSPLPMDAKHSRQYSAIVGQMKRFGEDLHHQPEHTCCFACVLMCSIGFYAGWVVYVMHVACFHL
jgi:hypothetical protein